MVYNIIMFISGVGESHVPFGIVGQTYLLGTATTNTIRGVSLLWCSSPKLNIGKVRIFILVNNYFHSINHYQKSSSLID